MVRRVFRQKSCLPELFLEAQKLCKFLQTHPITQLSETFDPTHQICSDLQPVSPRGGVARAPPGGQCHLLGPINYPI